MLNTRNNRVANELKLGLCLAGKDNEFVVSLEGGREGGREGERREGGEGGREVGERGEGGRDDGCTYSNGTTIFK